VLVEAELSNKIKGHSFALHASVILGTVTNSVKPGIKKQNVSPKLVNAA